VRCIGPFLHRWKKWEERTFTVGEFIGSVRVGERSRLAQYRECDDCGRGEARWL